MLGYLYKAKEIDTPENRWVEGFLIGDKLLKNFKIKEIEFGKEYNVDKSTISKILEITMNNENQDILCENDKIEIDGKIYTIKYVEEMTSYIGTYLVNDKDNQFTYYRPINQLLDGKYLGQ